MDGTAEFPCNAHRRQRQQTNRERFRTIKGTENKQSYTLNRYVLMRSEKEINLENSLVSQDSSAGRKVIVQ
jgi:hypothetical protein